MAAILPSLTSLRAFEAAARYLSFTRAAEELNQTQTAISHQIKKLEDLLGVALFLRDGNAIHLTDVGRQYLDEIRALLVEVSNATDRARTHRWDNVLHIACLPLFLSKSLLPIIGEFCENHPHLSIRLLTVLSSEHLALRNYDVAIRYGSGDWPGFVATKLCDEEIFPVCSPDLRPRLRQPKDLRSHTAIRTTFSFILHDDWPLWLEASNVKDLEFKNQIVCDLLATAFQAAVNGLGVAIGRSPMVLPDLAVGTLVEPFNLRLRSRSSYYVSSPTDRAQMPNSVLFRDWLLQKFVRAVPH